MTTSEPLAPFIARYLDRLTTAASCDAWPNVERLADELKSAWEERRQVFLCGNGGSAANAIHLANDLLYGVAKETGVGMRVTALPANASVLTCLANDIAYEQIFAQQLSVLASPSDVLIVLSGSGNSPNVVQALARAKQIGMTSFAIVGFSGGKCRELADFPIHFPIDDMQISEDLQTIVGHMVMQHLAGY